MSTDATLEPRQRYDALAAALSTRRSTLHFAHAGIASAATLIFAGTAGRLFVKGTPDQAPLGALAAAIAVGLFTYAVVRVFIGRHRLTRELEDFAKLQVLRQELGLDDPKRLMP